MIKYRVSLRVGAIMESWMTSPSIQFRLTTTFIFWLVYLSRHLNFVGDEGDCESFKYTAFSKFVIKWSSSCGCV